MSIGDSRPEFDFSAFETEVTKVDEDRIIGAIDGSIDRLREQIEKDDTLDKTFTRGLRRPARLSSEGLCVPRERGGQEGCLKIEMQHCEELSLSV